MAEKLFELARRTFDTPQFRGIEFIEVGAKSIINHVPGNNLPFEWTINPYRGCTHACKFCFARSTHTYMEMDAGRDFETKIVVKVNAPDLLRKELRARRWRGDSIAMGTATDPYQRAEGKYRLMRGILRALIDVHNPFSILTKGTLILRDVDLLTEAAGVTDVSTAFSVPTLDEDVWRRSEPGTPHPRKRLAAVAELNRSGIRCGVMVAPVLPGISDGREGLEAVVEGALEAGAAFVTPILLHLRPVVREVYMEWLAGEYPGLVETYEELYRRSAYAPGPARAALAEEVAALVQERGGISAPRPRAWRRPRRVAPGPAAEQLRLI